MSLDPATAVICVLEVAGLGSSWTPQQLRSALGQIDLPIRVVGELANYPSVVVEADLGTAVQLTQLIAESVKRIEVTELRRHVHIDCLKPGQLRQLITDSHAEGRLAVGAAAVERAMQRRRLDVVVLAAGLVADYKEMLRTIIEHNRYAGPLVVSDLSRDELGQAAGVRRAGCVGLVRGRRHVSL